jgi:large subunit ribosomal protein L24
LNNNVHVKKGDQVVVLSGKDKGKRGKVLSVFPSDSKVIVEGVNMATKHVKPRKAGQGGGILHQEVAVNASKVMIYCNKCETPSRVGVRELENKTRVRFCKNCKELFND